MFVNVKKYIYLKDGNDIISTIDDLEKTLEQKLDKFMDNSVEYFRHMTQNNNYTYHNVVEWHDGEYVFTHPITEENIKAMRENMSPEDMRAFDNFVDTAWG